MDGDNDALDQTVDPEDLGPIHIDVPCVTCGYNLRGLTIEKACPECGTAAGRSVMGDQLEYADPQWVGRLAMGMNLIIGGIAVAVVFTLFGRPTWLFPAAFQAAADRILSRIDEALFLIGCWYLTASEPRHKVAGFGAATVARVGLTAGMLIGLPLFAIANLALPIVVHLTMIAAAVASVTGTIGLAIHARGLALRGPYEELANRIRSVAIVYVVGIVLAVIISVVDAVTATPGGGRPTWLSSRMLRRMGGCMARVLIVGFHVWALVVVVQFRWAMVHAAAKARSTWASTV